MTRVKRKSAMSVKNKKEIYDEQYEASKKGGETFFPEILFRDAIVALGVLIAIILLAAFLPARSGAQADPSATFAARPAWYFSFFYEFLKLFPGWLEPVAAIVIPVIAILTLVALPFWDRGMDRRWSKRKWVLIIGSLALLLLVVLEFVGARSLPLTPPTIM